MSEIPIGSPPAPPGRHAAPPGWFPDPVDRSQERYWDGWQWSRTTRPAESPIQPTGGAGAGAGGSGRGRGGAFAPGSGTAGGGGYDGRAGDRGHGAAPGQSAPGTGGPQGPSGSSGSSGWHGSGWSGSPGMVSGQAGGGFATSAPGTQQMYTADGVPMAAWGFRAVAALIDLILVGAVTMAVSTPFYLPMWRAVAANVEQTAQAYQTGAAPPASPTIAELSAMLSSVDRLIITVLAAAIGLAYYVLFWRLRSATLGQLMFRLRVVPVDRAQGIPALSWSSALIRAIVWVVPRLTPFLLIFWALNCLFPLWNARRQALHDLAARTQVVRIR